MPGYFVGQVLKRDERWMLSDRDYEATPYHCWHAVDSTGHDPYSFGRSLCGLKVMNTHTPFEGVANRGKGQPLACLNCIRLMLEFIGYEYIQLSEQGVRHNEAQEALQELDEILEYSRWAVTDD